LEANRAFDAAFVGRVFSGVSPEDARTAAALSMGVVDGRHGNADLRQSRRVCNAFGLRQLFAAQKL